MHLLNDFYEANKQKYNIFIVYINEAHAADVWNIGESAGAINYSHKKISDRLLCCKKFQDEFKTPIPIYCDNMDNDFESSFSCWPVRYFVTLYNKLITLSNPENSEIDICELFQFIKNYEH